MKRRFILVTFVAVLSVFAWGATLAAPPYDVDVTLTAPTTGGPVDHYVLYLDNVAVAATARSPALADGNNIAVGANSYPDLLTTDGIFVFEVGAVNQMGETRSDPVTIDTSLPGKPSIEVTISFTAT